VWSDMDVAEWHDDYGDKVKIDTQENDGRKT